MARNWADLPQELLQLCSRCLCLKNLSAFRAVCHSWRSAAVKERSDIPWLMVVDKKEILWHKFFCLPCQRVHKKLLPEGMAMAMAMAKNFFSSRGWVLTISIDWEFHMLENPTSRYNRIITVPGGNKFPNVTVLPPIYFNFISKFVLSDSPTKSLDYKVMVIFGIGALGLWKPGQEEWTILTTPSDIHHDVIYYKGCFVAVDSEQRILRCNVDGPAPFEAQVVFEMPQRLQSFEQDNSRYCVPVVEVYLMQSMTGSLLHVLRWELRGPTKTYLFRVSEIDLDTQTCTEVESLENMSLFLGDNSSFSLEVNENHLIQPNCIYFTENSFTLARFSADRDIKMGIYHLEDGTVEWHVKGKSPLLWIEPSF